MRKYDMISGLAQYTAKEVVRNEESWRKYLNTASRLYKYSFKDQLLIYAQRPDATACASIEIWNETMNCWVNKGAKGIALIDDDTYSGLKYVFDISDVHKARRIGRFPNLWEMKEEHTEAVLDRLESIYGETDAQAGFTDRIREIAGRIAEECYRELAMDMEYLKEGSFLEELDELNIEVRIRETLADSIAYTVLKRCGMDEQELAEQISFPYIHDFNTVETLSQLGTNVSDLSKPILMEIGKAIGAYDRQIAPNRAEMSVGGEHIDTHEKNIEKGLANASTKDYNALKRESDTPDEQSITQTGNAGERSQNDEFSIRAERGLSDTDVTDGQAAGGDSDEVRTDEEEVLTGEQERSLYGTASEGQTERTPAYDTGTGRAENGASDRTDDGESGSDGTAQGGQSDALGADDEQHQTLSGGNRTDGVDLQLNTEPTGAYQQLSLFPSFEEQVGTIAAAEASIQYTMPAAFSLPQDQIDTILRSGGGRDNSRKRIYAKYQQGKSPEEMTEFLKNEYKTTGKGFEFDGNPVSLWFDEMGMRIGYGTSAKENTLALMSWSEVESHIRTMVENGTYMSANEVFLVDAVERERIATDINNFFRDGVSEMPESLELKFSNYPESMEKLCELLSTAEGRGLIKSELEKAQAQLDSGEKQIKWKYVKRPDYLLEQLADLGVEKKEFPALDTVDVKLEDFITQDEIDYRLTGGSGFQHGKFRIYEYFMEGHDKKANVDFLKNEYGTGGSSHALPGSDSGHEDHDAKGIRLEKGNYGSPYAKVLLNWNVVEKRIRELVQADRYLSPEGKEAYAQYEQEQAEEAMRREAEKLEHGVRVECKEAIEKAIAENFGGYTLPRDTAKAVIEQFGKERVEMVLANTIMHNSQDGRFSVNNKEWAKSLVPYANWDTRDYAVTSHPAVLDGFTNQVRRYVERDREPDKALVDKVTEMSVVAQICGELGRKDVVEWNEETGAVMIVDGEQSLEGKAVYDTLLVDATDFVMLQTISGDIERAVIMDGLLKQAKEFSERYAEVPEQTGEKAELEETESMEQSADEPEVVAEGGAVEEQADDFSNIDVPIIHDVEQLQTEAEPESVIDKTGAVNFRIDPGEESTGKGFAPKEKFRQNVEAIRTLEKIESEHRIATPEEQQILAKYVGWGGLADAFDETKANWASEYQELKSLLSSEEYASARESTLNAHYTSPVIIKAIYDAIDKMGFSKGNILDMFMQRLIQFNYSRDFLPLAG